MKATKLQNIKKMLNKSRIPLKSVVDLSYATFSFFQFCGLHGTFWPLKSLAFICPHYFESKVLLKGHLDVI